MWFKRVHLNQCYFCMNVIRNPIVITLSGFQLTYLKVCDEDAEVPWSVSNDDVTGSHPTHFEQFIFIFLTKTKVEWSLFRRLCTSVVQKFFLIFNDFLRSPFTVKKLCLHSGKKYFFFCQFFAISLNISIVQNCFDYRMKSLMTSCQKLSKFLPDRQREL